jgi:hypothetical protein
MERACALLGTPAPGDSLRTAANEYDVRIAALIADDQELVDYVARLESMVDDDESPFFVADDDADEPVADAPPLDAGNADELVAEVEQFLRDRDT